MTTVNKKLQGAKPRKRMALKAISTQSTASNKQDTKRQQHTSPLKATRSSNAQPRVASQETPPAFACTRGKQSFQKRKLRLEQQRKQESDQQRIQELVQYFKSVDNERLTFASA